MPHSEIYRIVHHCMPLGCRCAQKAMCKLIRGGEIELAVSVGLVLKSVDAQLRVAVELLSRRCENLGKWLVILICFSVGFSETFYSYLYFW